MNENETTDGCPVELHTYKLEELKVKQEDHENRLKILEENRTEVRMEFAGLKQSYSDLKSLVLELNTKQNDKMETNFGKMMNSQLEIQNRIIESQTARETNKTELSKTKLALYGGVITGTVTIIVTILEKLFN